MSDRCPWRLLTADGRTLECNAAYDVPHHPDVTEQEHSHLDDDDRLVRAWMHGDPMSWDATCPDCDGAGELTDCGSPIPCPTCDWEAVPCEACAGSGVVADVPTRLVGVGSTLEHHLDAPGVFCLVAGVREGRTGTIVDLVSVNAVHHAVLLDQIGRDEPWRLVRAVPPAAPTEEHTDG